MTRIVFLSALTALVGCKKDECEDTAGTGACDTGADDHTDHDHDADEGGDDDGTAPTAASCTFGATICIETTAADPAGWCSTEGGTHADEACAAGYDGMCAIPGGQEGTYADAATAYYYGMDGTEACTGVGGTYTAS